MENFFFLRNQTLKRVKIVFLWIFFPLKTIFHSFTWNQIAPKGKTYCLNLFHHVICRLPSQLPSASFLLKNTTTTKWISILGNLKIIFVVRIERSDGMEDRLLGGPWMTHSLRSRQQFLHWRVGLKMFGAWTILSRTGYAVVHDLGTGT